MNKQELEKALSDAEDIYHPLQEKMWKLRDQLNEIDRIDFVESGVLSKVNWRVRTFNSYGSVFLQADHDREWKFDINNVIPYPHSKWQIVKGVTLNQDDGDITLIFDKIGQVQHYIKKWNLPILEWKNLDELIAKRKTYIRLEKFLKREA